MLWMVILVKKIAFRISERYFFETE